ncbi:ester cyclase [Scytonema sp. NUACC26]|uniref:ester cyclase n=1 Tax=Scytonema sp. NUACC26 TaxID=3140176 RepID=UPI0034DCBB7E
MDNETLARQFYAAFNTGNVDILDDILAVDWADRPAIPGQAPGPDGEKATIRAFRTAFPDVQFTLEDILVTENKVAVRSTIHATHQGKFLGIAPTNRSVTFRTMDIHRIAEGRIAETWHLEDFYGLLQQINASL